VVESPAPEQDLSFEAAPISLSRAFVYSNRRRSADGPGWAAARCGWLVVGGRTESGALGDWSSG